MEMHDGQYVLSKDSVVHFLFEGISEVELEGFNEQNVLSALNISMTSDVLHVELEHCYQFCGTFNARRAVILGIHPLDDIAKS